MGILFKNGKKDDEEQSLSEDTLLAFNAVKGDMASFEKLVRKYERFVSTCVYRTVSDNQEVLDISQEVFLKMYKGLSGFKGQSSFSSWLYRIAKNCAYDYLRRQKGYTVSLDSTDEDGKTIDITDTNENINPENSYLKNEKQVLCWKPINSLSDDHKEIIVMRDINGMSYDDIATILNIETGTVKSRLFRAREALKKALMKENYF